MKILQVVHSFPPYNLAGTEIYTYSLSRELTKRNEVFIFHRISNIKKGEYALNHNKFNGLDVFTVNNTFRFCASFEGTYKNEAIADQFIKILNKIKPDIVHIQHLIFLSTTIITEIKKRKIPIIFTLHDYWLICPRWHFLNKAMNICNHNDISKCVDCLGDQLSIKKFPKRIYLALRNTMPNFLMRFLRNIYLNLTKANLNSQEMVLKIKSRNRHIKELCSIVDLFVAPSDFARKMFIRFGIPQDKIRFIPHGINTELVKNFKRKESDRIRFGFIGTILPAKGPDILINAFNRINDTRVELKIYGKLFPYREFEYYPRYIKRLAKNGNIRFMGGFDHKQICDIFSEIDVLVLPSIWNENLPLTILEAFSTKTPVIASRIGGIPELIKDGEHGWLFEPRNSESLYKQMKIFLDNPSLIERFKNLIKHPKSIKENAQEIEKLYTKLLDIK
ncbi:MAG: glycosyltransferase family 4 protein [Candidatus Omnitrophica bacterium]|nr:glycosyltransferase family 4 protein [Candidatus Omnitrophota bacterium]